MTFNFAPVQSLLEELIHSKTVPGCALSIRKNGAEIFKFGLGMAELTPSPRTATSDTIWDLASLTKVLCTAHLYLLWANNGQVDLHTEIHTVLPYAPRGITLQHCLSHCSGYPNWRPFYSLTTIQPTKWGDDSVRTQMLKKMVSTNLSNIPGQIHCYSDIGFLALCAFAEAKFGKQIHLLWNEYLPESARKDLYWGHPDAAATEQCPIRRRMIRGEVHDLNAAILGGKSTHAGLFGSVSALTEAAEWPLLAYHGKSTDLEADSVRYFWTTKGPGSHVLGWDTPSDTGSTASDHWPKNGIGHLGFTGTSLWIAPDEQLIVGFASNRVHPKVEGGAVPFAKTGEKTAAFRAFRPKLHQTILEVLG